MPRELALTKIWRDDNYFTSRSMDVYIAKLRKYLSVGEQVEIINIHGEGFRLVVKARLICSSISPGSVKTFISGWNPVFDSMERRDRTILFLDSS